MESITESQTLNEAETKPPPYGGLVFFAIGLLGIAAIYGIPVLGLSSQIPSETNRSQGDPGGAFLPLTLCLCLVVIGLGQAITNRNNFRQPQSETPIHWRIWLSLVFAMLGFVLAIPVFGFSATASLFLFTVGLLWKTKWYWSLLLTALVIGFIEFVFRIIFEVQLPAGSLVRMFFR